ncbi:EAL domain-containing protein [Pseudomonas sp. LS1212]|uniref:EAL domain-containing response regulator n=1 Tax=Pseudomonas sp. LS1212 TaxID=2972478 RepID=UPI00215C02D1|nr:EAL domain-containing protein [Pseudomonas sp. LS1212]UVJ46063.1 EAL domain-containing protein [Pseudomonas sp. LS1212]
MDFYEGLNVPADSLRVLVLENHAFQRSIAVKMLGQLGCRHVFESAYAGEALALLKQVGAVDIVVCDLRLEGMDGLEFIQRAAQKALIKHGIVSCGLSAELRRGVIRMVSLLGLSFLGDAGKPLKIETLGHLLDSCGAPEPQAQAAVSEANCLDECDVRRGLANKEFFAFYLPRCDVLSGSIKGVDVLAHWDHPLQGLLPPSLFMPVIERCGLLDEMLLTMLDQGLELQRELMVQGIGFRLTFGLHTDQLSSRHLSLRIKSLLQFYRSAGMGIGFELTPQGLFEPSAMGLESLIRLRLLGCDLCLGDFGANQASLLHFCQLPFNQLKVAGPFMTDLENQPRNRAVIKSCLMLADALGLGVTVAGVENAGQHLILLDMNCAQGQGRYFAPPLSRDDLSRRLTSSVSLMGDES